LEANNPNVFPIDMGNADVDVYADEAQTMFLGEGDLTGQYLKAKQTKPSDLTLTVKIDGINKKPGGQELVDAVLKNTHSMVYGE